MKAFFKITLLLFIALFTFQSCEDIDDVAAPEYLQVNDFIWKGLNLYYLWQADVPNLADSRFANQAELNAFLTKYPSPEDLFDALRVDKSVDRFSWIVSDYLELEGMLQGTTKNDGVDFGLYRKASGSNDIFGYVRYIIPNSDASTKDIKRGDIFYGVNGTQLTVSNYQTLLLNSENYTLNLADYNNGQITPNGKSVTLTKTELSENPILINNVIETGSHKIGYLMYNGFYPNYDSQLNDAFATLKSQGITDLVLDLRYNSGGSVQSSTRLASMITGQFTDKVFSKQRWNDKINAYFESEDPNALKNLFTNTIDGEPINSLNLKKIYILTTNSTASASELVINGLKPYIEVVQIGDITTGKNVGSITIYDSPTFGKENRNPLHRYAMQPIVLKIVNADDFGDYFNGLTPTYSLKENITNLGVLGNSSEPLLSTAIGKITGTAKMVKKTEGKTFQYFEDTKSINGQNQMYVDKVPAGLLKSL
ncbi:S41 family peptidase [Flavobacterium granuli]|uniref:C-terminal processing protease CtpA/Prc n=1 Tax=Flavobacterium granuli TaxID=280093 RepID=A0ABU1S650_9FLAO|nr:S41 family peptidase [Flavobacterium granuli]MDR6846516.1 C-terminal processing protease CtpA/Prc [Flavobacterium granuli]